MRAAWAFAARNLGCPRVTKQGAAHILQPLLKAKLVKRVGTRKTGRYILG
jgi:hypothetical protein